MAVGVNVGGGEVESEEGGEGSGKEETSERRRQQGQKAY